MDALLILIQGPAGVDLPDGVTKLLEAALTLIKWAAPILLVVFGSLDLGKAVMAGEEKEIKAAQKMLGKRAVAAIAIFFLVSIVDMILGIIGEGPSGV